MNILSISKFRATIAALALTLTVAVAAPAANAQQQTHTVKVNVPFAFGVNGTQLPAGIYTIRELSGHVLQIRGAADSALFVSNDAEGSPKADKARIVFTRYGDQYFLHAVVHADGAKECVESKAEKQARQTMVAANQAKSSGVEVALAELNQ